ncbi:MAG: sulfotransferase [Desulfovermiculus sp.]
MAKNEYGAGARLLHHLALSSRTVGELSFQIDHLLHKADPTPALDRRHIFVSGLARAGTTAIMRLLYATGQFCSLTYRDMPFPLAPSLWRMFILRLSTRDGDLRERAHGDRMLVDFDSPEALEEVFWRVFCGQDYILTDKLVPMQADPKSIDLFRRYIAKLMDIHNAERYVSKNNNNILRLSSIYQAFPQALIIIPFRDPIQQSLSLFAQHRHFVQVHSQDTFSKKYMKWLVHHEFGSDHRPFEVDDHPSSYSPETPSYWLEQWIRVYRYILEQAHRINGAITFVEYERLCTDPAGIWKSLARLAGLPESLPSGFSLSQAPARGGFSPDPALHEEAYAIYSQLQKCFEDDVYGS